MQALYGLTLSGTQAPPPQPPPAPPPPPVQTQLWVDASNYTGAFTDQMMQDLRNAGVTGVIPQAITGLDNKTYTSQQCQKAADWGFLLMGYVWCFPGESTSSIDTRLSMFQGKPIRKLWADVEQAGVSTNDVNLLLARSDHYLPSQRTGIYTAKWFWDQQGWGVLWPGRDLWDANYDGQADPTVGFVPFGGWTSCVVKQFAGTSSIGSMHQIDLDVMEG